MTSTEVSIRANGRCNVCAEPKERSCSTNFRALRNGSGGSPENAGREKIFLRMPCLTRGAFEVHRSRDIGAILRREVAHRGIYRPAEPPG